MSSSKKPKRSHSAEGGITVLEAQPETMQSSGPVEMETSGAVAQVETEFTAESTTLWQRSKQVTAVWCKSEERNSWVAIAGVGWKKLADYSDSANVALSILAAQALQTSRNIDYREESDGMIHEIYLW
jgi:hypothetical protein